MTNFVETFPLAYLEGGHGDSLSIELYRLWKRGGGGFDERLLMFAPHLILMDARAEPGDSPQILYSGDKTLATTVFGADWATADSDMRGSINSGFRRVVSAGYHAAIENRAPQYELISAELPPVFRACARSTIRAPAPAMKHTRSGTQQLSCYATL
ncbi:MAG: hypothetical protein HPM95_18870 [Alphaproteobacteria bacterium]|nr:hypothetical protein [Alphaproteobacteria bacterium]